MKNKQKSQKKALLILSGLAVLIIFGLAIYYATRPTFNDRDASKNATDIVDYAYTQLNKIITQENLQDTLVVRQESGIVSDRSTGQYGYIMNITSDYGLTVQAAPQPQPMNGAAVSSPETQVSVDSSLSTVADQLKEALGTTWLQTKTSLPSEGEALTGTNYIYTNLNNNTLCSLIDGDGVLFFSCIERSKVTDTQAKLEELAPQINPRPDQALWLINYDEPGGNGYQLANVSIDATSNLFYKASGTNVWVLSPVQFNTQRPLLCSDVEKDPQTVAALQGTNRGCYTGNGIEATTKLIGS